MIRQKDKNLDKYSGLLVYKGRYLLLNQHRFAQISKSHYILVKANSCVKKNLSKKVTILVAVKSKSIGNENRKVTIIYPSHYTLVHHCRFTVRGAAKPYSPPCRRMKKKVFFFTEDTEKSGDANYFKPKLIACTYKKACPERKP